MFDMPVHHYVYIMTLSQYIHNDVPNCSVQEICFRTIIG